MIDIYTKLVDWIDSVTGEDVTVIVRNPSAANQPPAPFVSIKIQSNRDTGHSGNGMTSAGDAIVTRYKVLTLAVQVQGAAGGDILQAEDIAQDIIKSLYNQNLMIDKLGRSLAYANMLMEPTDVSYNAGNRWIPRIQFDLSFNAAEDLTIDSGAIETVAYTGEVEQHHIQNEVHY